MTATKNFGKLLQQLFLLNVNIYMFMITPKKQTLYVLK